MSSEGYQKILEAINQSASITREELKGYIDHKNNEIVDIINRYSKEQTEKIAFLEEKCAKLENKNLELERRLRRNNLLVFNLEHKDTDNLITTFVSFCKNKLNVVVTQSDINNIFLLKPDHNNVCPIKIELVTYLKKQEIFANAPKLKGCNVFVAHDLCFEDREERKILQNHLKEAKAKNLNAKIKGRKLIVNGDEYSVKELKEGFSFEQYSLEPPETGPETETDKPPKSVINSAPNTPTIEKLDQIFQENYPELTNSSKARKLSVSDPKTDKRPRDSLGNNLNLKKPDPKKKKDK